MNNFNDEIDYFVDKMNDNKIPKNKQIEYLKMYSKLLNEQREKIDNSFLFGTFISGIGIGNLFDNPYLSIGMISTGVIISIAVYAKNYPDITIDDVKIKTKKKP